MIWDMAHNDQRGIETTSDPPENRERIRFATVVVAIIFTIVAVLWAREAELIAFACQITEAIPPMTALGGLLLFVALSLLIRRLVPGISPFSPAVANFLQRLSMSGRQVMFMYAFIMVGTIVFSVGVIRTILPELTTLTYFADPSNEFAEARPFVSEWLHVSDPDAVRQYYEGLDEPAREPKVGNIPVISPLMRTMLWPVERTRVVPWQVWWKPLLAWSIFILVMFATMHCMAVLAEREWTVAERLPYPLVEIPLGVTETHSFVKGVPFLRDPVMWIGFLVGASYGIHEMIAATTLAFPAWGRQYPLGALLTERPWNIVGGNIDIFLMPEAYGLAYFASQEVLLSTGVTWLGYCLYLVLMTALGRSIPGSTVPDVSLGSFVGFVVAAIWIARKPLGGAFRMAFGLPKADDEEELPALHGWMARGVLVGTLFLLGFIVWMGLPTKYALYAVVVFYISALGHARVRAMAGAATPWLFPHSAMTQSYQRLFGSGAIGARGDYRPFAAIFHLRWIDRGYGHSALAAQLESYNMARRGNLHTGDLTWFLILAVPIGLALGWWMHITAFYDAGANVLEGGGYEGGARTRYGQQDATWAIGLVNMPTAVLPASWVAVISGIVITISAVVLRNLFLRFPFHPAGFVIGMNHGRRFWAPFLIVYLIKGVLLHTGGVGSYRRLMPFFLGVVVGHFFFTGIVMGLAKMTGLPAFENLPIIWF